jgi:hypothetical protein
MSDASSTRPFPALRSAAPWIALLVIIAGAAAIRLHLLDVPLERDEGGYAYFGQRLLAGEPPFASGYTIHLPGTTAVYAAAMAAFGQTTEGVRLGLIIANALTILLIFFLARSSHGNVGAIAASATYATLSLSPQLLGPFGHANHFVTLFGVAGLWALSRALPSGRLVWFGAAGLLFGLAPVMKQSGAVFPVFAAGWLVWLRLRAGQDGRRALRREAPVLFGASMIGLALTSVLLAAASVLPRAWFWISTYASAYAGMETTAGGLRNLGTRLSLIVPASLGFLALALAGLVLSKPPGAEPTPLAGRGFAAALLGATFAAACPGLYFRHHYFIPMIPAVALLCARSVAILARRSGPGTAAGLIAVSAAVLQTLTADVDVLFRLSPVQVSRRVYGANPFPESIEVARYLAANSGPDDRIAVLGSEPQINFYAQRRSATGFMYLYPLVEPNPFGPAMQKQLIREIEQASPAFLVWVDIPSSWAARVGAARPIVTWAGEYLASGYHLVGRVAIRGPDRTDYAWGPDAVRLGVEGANILVFRRNGP